MWLTDEGKFLRGHAFNGHSQYGEQGLIEGALERYGAATRTCFEVGAGDGVTLSNTKFLRERGWSALLIESDPILFGKCLALGESLSVTLHRKLGPRDLDLILFDCEFPEDVDLGVIDIDSYDYWVWKNLTYHRPRLVLIEFAYNMNNHQLFPEEESVDAVHQAGIYPILQLGAEKGYVPLAKTLCNVLFVRGDIHGRK